MVFQVLGQLGRHGPGPGEQQDAGCILVQPVHQTRLFGVAKGQRFGQPIDMQQSAGAALGRQTIGFVDRDDMLITVNHRRLNHLDIGGGQGAVHRLPRHLALVRHRRDADHLAHVNPGGRFHPAAINAQFALAAHLFNAPLRQMREMLAQPTVQPLIAFVRTDCPVLYAAHPRAPLVIEWPNAQAPSDKVTEASTYKAAIGARPASTSRNVSSEKAENVVNPPKIPVISKGAHGPRSANATHSTPIRNDPTIFTASVPNGKASANPVR